MNTYMICLVVLVFKIVYATANCVDIIERDEWGARSPNQIQYSIKPVRYAIIHNTETPECFTEADCMRRIYNMQYYHMNKLDFDDIGYNFLIGSDGNIYEGVGWHKIGAHAKGFNKNSIGIGFIGSFNNKLPTAEALNAAKTLLDCGLATGELEKNYRLIGARQVRPTTSPGLKLYREIKKWRHWTASP